MKKIRVIATLVALVALVVFVATGCIGSGDENSQFDHPDRVTVQWLAYQTNAQPQRDAAVIQAIEEKYGVNLHFWFIEAARYEELLGVRLAAGEMPDIFRLPNLGTLPRFVTQGIAAEITEEMLSLAPAYVESIHENGDWDQTFIDATIDGRIYALKHQSLAGAYPTTLAWRTDWLRNVGIDRIPETLEEFEEAMYRFTFHDPNGSGVNDTYGMSETTMNAIFGAFGEIPINRFNLEGGIDTFNTVDVNGEMTFAVIQPTMMEPLRILNRWFEMGLIDPNFITGENTGGHWAVSQAFENGRIGVTGMGMINHWHPPFFEGGAGGVVYQSMRNVNPNMEFGRDFYLGTAPIGPGGHAATHQWGTVDNGGTIVTTQAARNPEVINFIFTLLNDLYSDMDVEILVGMGIEDVTFEYTPQGIRQVLADFPTAADHTRAGLGVMRPSGGSNPAFIRAANPALFDFMDRFKGPGIPNYRAPNVPSRTRYIGSLHRFAVESYMFMITGERDIDTFFPEFVETFLQQGGQTIIDDTNEAIRQNRAR